MNELGKKCTVVGHLRTCKVERPGLGKSSFLGNYILFTIYCRIFSTVQQGVEDGIAFSSAL